MRSILLEEVNIFYLLDARMSTQSPRNPLQIPEIIALVLDHVCFVPDLLSCACVNSKWHGPAVARLYEGSLYDIQFRTLIFPLSTAFILSAGLYLSAPWMAGAASECVFRSRFRYHQ